MEKRMATEHSEYKSYKPKSMKGWPIHGTVESLDADIEETVRRIKRFKNFSRMKEELKRERQDLLDLFRHRVTLETHIAQDNEVSGNELLMQVGKLFYDHYCMLKDNELEIEATKVLLLAQYRFPREFGADFVVNLHRIDLEDIEKIKTGMAKDVDIRDQTFVSLRYMPNSPLDYW
jgi:hypothetical protein